MLSFQHIINITKLFIRHHTFSLFGKLFNSDVYFFAEHLRLATFQGVIAQVAAILDPAGLGGESVP